MVSSYESQKIAHRSVRKDLQLGLSKSLLTFPHEPHGAFLSWLCFANICTFPIQDKPNSFYADDGLGLAIGKCPAEANGQQITKGRRPCHEEYACLQASCKSSYNDDYS